MATLTGTGVDQLIERVDRAVALGGAETIGPILLGVGAPVHVLQAGDDVEEIVAMTAVAVMDARGREALGERSRAVTAAARGVRAPRRR